MTSAAIRGAAAAAVLGLMAVLGGCVADPVPGDPPGASSTETGTSPATTLAAATSGATSTIGPSTAGGPADAGPGEPRLVILPVGSSEQALNVDGRIRMYRAHRPARLVRFAPLVVMFHGGLGSARQAERAYGWNALADRYGFVVLYPDALGAAWNVGGDCCGIAPATGVDDVGFVRLAIADLRTRVSLDASRTFAVGMSNGGMMAYRLACDTTLFAAIGAVAATQLGDCTNPAPASVLHIHGTADTSVPYTGVPGEGIAQINGPAIPDLHRLWRTIGRCGGDVIRSDREVTTMTADCPESRTVELVSIDGGGHEWPGVGRRGPLDAFPDPRTPGPSASGPATSTTTTSPGSSAGPGATAGAQAAYVATDAIWEFLSTHGR
ncbi:MAG: hypothetical protein IPL45_10900 [Actinomycetales bacterium]|nr:hypothetical protein [Actinomycetales bacterium]